MPPDSEELPTLEDSTPAAVAIAIMPEEEQLISLDSEEPTTLEDSVLAADIDTEDIMVVISGAIEEDITDGEDDPIVCRKT
jgi:hypothetical protein